MKSGAERNLEVMRKEKSVTRTHLRTPHTALDRNRPSVAEPEEQFGGRGAAAGAEEDRDSRGQHTERKNRRKRTSRLFQSGLIHCIHSNTVGERIRDVNGRLKDFK